MVTPKQVAEYLTNLTELGAIQNLFAKLNYEVFDEPVDHSGWGDGLARENVAEARIINRRGQFNIAHVTIPARTIHGRDFLPRSPQRAIFKQLERDFPFLFVVFSDEERRFWDFTSVKLVAEKERTRGRRVFRRIYVEAGRPKRTVVERLALLYAESDDLFKIQEQCFDRAFDVNAVTKEFYEEYHGLYLRLSGQLPKANRAMFGDASTQHRPNEFAQRLMGRVMFLYFLQRKGWLGDDTDFLRKEFWKADEKGKNFYRDVLETVWFRCLNTPDKREGLPDPYKSIPYLNGGLFTPDYAFDTDELLPLPNDFFSTDHLRQGEGDGLLDIFDRYNFTIEESTPLDQEVAVDPEMLGKVLENLLEEEERKKEGVYYTPRPIVDFMCRESLLGYLADQTGIGRESLEELLDIEKLQEAEWKEEHGEDLGYSLNQAAAKRVLDALENVKVLDPAVGSGAFPLGMMHNLMQVYRAAGVIRGERIRPDSNVAAERKMKIIADNLYGVDIKSEAIEIARLRLWLSLVVEQRSPDEVEPLPNLDFKFMVGDSLIEEIEGIPIYPVAGGGDGELGIQTPKVAKAQEKLIELEESYFNAHTAAERKELEEEIQKAVLAVVEGAVDEGLMEIKRKWKVHDQAVAKRSTKKLEQERQALIEAEARLRGIVLQARDAEKPLPFFPFRLFFGEVWREGREGFDIVIANPPYVRQEKFEGGYKEKLARHYEDVYTSVCDIYVPFYKRGFELLKPGGYLTFISSGTYARTGFGEKLRRWLRNNVTIRRWVDFGDLQPFEDQTTYPVVPVFKNRKADGGRRLAYYQLPDLDYGDFSEKVERGSFEVVQSDLADDGYRFLRPEVKAVFDKIVAAGRPLREVVGEIYRGVLTGFNEAFIVDGPTKDRLIAEDPKSAELLKPFLMGRDLKPWRYEFKDRWLIFTRHGVDIKRYPAIKRHLEQYKNQLKPRPKGVPKEGWKGRKP
ncbi:MAG TPA: Eco57I restriction-modification methylase domain-containing protein, partial [bacterium]|nr:Eco57I restriction-modification methylase domain-containing protein [bacterium]